jgi:hypothetical protein
MVIRDASDPPKPIIFDWDDTICPSSFVDQFQIEVFEDLPVRVSTATPLFLLETLILRRYDVNDGSSYRLHRRCLFS